VLLPSWVDPDEDKPAPMPLLRVQSFINTRDVAEGTDRLAEPEHAGAWLAAAGLIGSESEVGPAELREACEAREGLRALVRVNHGGVLGSEDLGALRKVAAQRRPAVSVDASGAVELGVAEGGDLPDGLLGLLLIVRDAQADGTWLRLKLCANPECEWAFFDRSRNRQGSWCTMAACGNRLKNRRFRARGREERGSRP
jgi:predicted RNA-binding Zn ribbon-like protein